MESLTFGVEPCGDEYVELIEFCCSKATAFLLVVRDPERDPGLGVGRSLQALAPWLVEQKRAREWPGTVLLADEAAVCRSRVDERLGAELLRQRERLFGWIHPEKPEDPCFLRADGGPLLVTISHEHDAFLSLASAEVDAVSRELPALHGVLRRET